MNYKDFEKLSEIDKKQFLQSKENIVEILNMIPSQMNAFLKNLKEEQLKYVIDETDEIVRLPQGKFMTLFSSLPSIMVRKLFDNKEILKRFMELPVSKLGHHPYRFLNEENKLYILKKFDIILKQPSYLEHIKELDKEYHEQYFEVLNEYLKITESDIFNENSNEVIRNVYKLHHTEDKKNIKKWFINKYEIEENSMCSNLFNLVLHNQSNLAYALTLKTEKEWLIYFRFGIYIPELLKEEEKSGIKLDKNILENICVRDIKHIYKEIIEIELEGKKSNYESLVLAIQLYSVFGLDNALKIVKGKFSKINEKVIEKAAITEFTDIRRKYRVEHQEHFYSYEMLQNVKKILKDENYELLGHIFLIDNQEIESLIQEGYRLWKEKKDDEELEVFLTYIIKDVIKDREKRLEQYYIHNYKLKYTNEDGNLKQIPIDLHQYFKEVDITRIELDEKGKPKIKQELIEFLLGNEKSDNDCTLRMSLNNLASGLNTTLTSIINNFDLIYDMIKKSKGKINIHSILDVVDASKVLIYELKPDEKDFTLETIAKIQNSRIYCEEPFTTIMERVKKLHHRRKKKISSTIPLIKGYSSNSIYYEIINFDDERMFTAGIDTVSCFKVGGAGEQFLEYCLLNKNGAVLALTDKDGKYYTCPLIRNGNGIFGNGIDPEPKTIDEMNSVITAVKEAFEKISVRSNNEEPIEIGVITDLHCTPYFSKEQYEIFDTRKLSIISNEEMYTDYFKSYINNYILYKEKDDVEFKAYNPTIEYYQPRPEPFTYMRSLEKDKERVELIINSIGYSLHKLDRNKRRKVYKPFIADNYTSIIGNKDWFIGFKEDLTLRSYCLPYDKRARQEMYRALSQVEQNINFQENMEEIKKCKNVKG